MDATMYLQDWEPNDLKEFHVPEPRLEVERDDSEIWLRFKQGTAMAGGYIKIVMNEEQFQQFAADCARVAAEKNQEVLRSRSSREESGGAEVSDHNGYKIYRGSDGKPVGIVSDPIGGTRYLCLDCEGYFHGAGAHQHHDGTWIQGAWLVKFWGADQDSAQSRWQNKLNEEKNQKVPK